MTVDERVEQIEAELENYETVLGLPPSYSEQTFEDVKKYLNMSRDELEKLHPQDCGQIAYRLKCFALHLARACNRETARYFWAESRIKTVIAKEINQYTGYQDKAWQAIQGNDVAKRLNEIGINSKQKSDRLAFLAKDIQGVSDVVKNLAWTKDKGD